MALSIKTEEADRLARELARRTGESMTEAVTVAMRERLERLVVGRRPKPAEYILQLTTFLDQLVVRDTRPITKAEWDEACGDDVTS